MIITERDTDISVMERQVWVEDLYAEWKRQTLGKRADPNRVKRQKKNANNPELQPVSNPAPQSPSPDAGY